MGTTLCHKTQSKNKVANSVPPNSLAKISVFEDEKIKKISENLHDSKKKLDETNEKKTKAPIVNENPQQNLIVKDLDKTIEKNEKSKEIPHETLPKPISSRENNERAIPESSNQEKGYVSHKMAETNLKNIGGGLIIKIKETGEVVDKYNKTLGYFHDHWRYYYINGKLAGWLENEKEIMDGGNLFAGYFENTGMVFDNRGNNLGKIEERGSFRDSKFSFVAKCEGEIKRMAIIFYFFHKEFQQKLIY